MSLKGHLGTIALPELLQWLAIGQKTGTLVIVKDDGVHRVVVDRGRIVSTSTSDPEMQMGPWLRRRNLVDEPTLERASKLREATGMSLGRVLMTLQAVGEDDLRDALRDKAEALISTLFHADNASFRFVEDGDLGDPGVALSLDATQLVLAAAHNLEHVAEAETAGAGGTDGAGSRTATTAPSPPRPTPEKSTATVIETLPEDLAPEPELELEPEPEPEPASPSSGWRDWRRTWGGLAAAVLLVAAVAAVFLIGRSQVPAKAEESVGRAAVVVTDLAPLAATDLAMLPVGERLEEEAATPPLDMPSEPPAFDDEPELDRGREAAAAEARLSRLLAAREAELRDEYRGELEELRRQLEAAQEPEPAAGEEVATLVSESPSAVDTDPAPAAVVRKPQQEARRTPPVAVVPPAGARPVATDEAGPLEVVAVDGAEEVAASEPVVAERTAAQLISSQPPVYPTAAQRLGREATVHLRVLVGEDGRAVEIETQGRKVGLGFDDAARTAARRSRWRPATENGSPVSSWVDLRYDFELP